MEAGLRVAARWLLPSLLLAGCAAAQVAPTPDASRVTIGTSPPQGPAAQLGTITATHGGGCGLYGTRGTLEGAYTILRNKSAQLGADYVQILRISEPHVVGGCLVQAFVIDGLAYKRALAAPEPPPATIAPPTARPASPWILWVAMGKVGAEAKDLTWLPTRGYDTRAACADIADAANDQVKGRSADDEARYVCLPDTVDPRGPKGK